MAQMQLNDDFKKFLRLLNKKNVEYLLVGGYAVAHHGHPRATGDLDVWISTTTANVDRVIEVLREFGFDTPDLGPGLFGEGKIIRMGVPPVRIKVQTSISGVEFSEASENCERVDIDGVEVPVISLADLRTNKRAAGRPKDLADLEDLPEA